MAVIKLYEPYEVAKMRFMVRDAFMMHGEQAILLQLFHPGDPDAVPCPNCTDDTYQSSDMECTVCYGTRWQGGVRYAMKVWGLVGDSDSPEQYTKEGVWQSRTHAIQLEAFPPVREHDVVVRVTGWNADSTPVALQHYYILQDVTQRSLRTGSRMGQTSDDIIGQKARMTRLPATMKGVTLYPILGNAFAESVQIQSGNEALNLPPSVVVEPDVRIVTIPFEIAPGGVEAGSPGTGQGSLDEGYTYTQEIPATTWSIQHNFSYDPAVAIIVDDEEVEADVDYPSPNLVVVSFNTAQAGEVRLT